MNRSPSEHRPSKEQCNHIRLSRHGGDAYSCMDCPEYFCMRPAHEPPAAPIFPIARLAIAEDDTVTATMYTPGLPPGEHDVYPVGGVRPPPAAQTGGMNFVADTPEPTVQRCLEAARGALTLEDARLHVLGALYLLRASQPPKADQCEVCTKPLPPVGAWSMPSCPDCQELLAFLGELQADYVDREKISKADLVGRAINLICARASQPPTTFPHRAIDCPHTEHTFQCNGCGLDIRNARLSQPPAGTRTDADYAIEHAGYLATAAEQFIQAIDDFDGAAHALEEAADDETEGELKHALDHAFEVRCDHRNGLANAVYEFRKRAERATSTKSAAAGEDRHDRGSQCAVTAQDPTRALPAVALCPSPFRGRPDEFTAAECIAAGECGCDARNGGEALPHLDTCSLKYGGQACSCGLSVETSVSDWRNQLGQYEASPTGDDDK